MSPESNVPGWADVQTPGGERHLPVYLLLDTSGSMDGAPIAAMNRGVELFQHETSGDPFARDVVRVGVITFSSDAQMLTQGLVSIADFKPPVLSASGVTRLDLALQKLLESMERDVLKAVKGGHKGDWKPVVFILTDGNPTDDQGNLTDSLWRPARETVVSRPKGQIKPSTIVAVGCGPNVDDATIKAISTGTAIRMDTDQASFTALFQYLTQSITSSVQPGGNVVDPFADVPLTGDLIRIP